MRIRRLHLSSDHQWKNIIELVGADAVTWDRLSRKNRIIAFITDPMSPVAANILKQCMLSGGADAIVSRHSISCKTDATRAVIVGTHRQLLRSCDSLTGQPFDLGRLAEAIRQSLVSGFPDLPETVTAGEKTLDFSRGPLIMGILNITEDSFSDGGEYVDPSKAIGHAEKMIQEGADIIDLGAESTRPGALPVPPGLQLKRLMPVLMELAGSAEIILSVDTASADVAEEALKCGAHMVNDVTALSDEHMAEVVSAFHVPVVLMHMRGRPENMQNDPVYNDVIQEIYDHLEHRIEYAVTAGVERNRIIVDPGIGFGKRLADNTALISRLAEFRQLGCRVLLGHSRKSFLGMLTGEETACRRDAGTHAVTALSYTSADIFRVHDVEGTRQVLRVAEGLERGV